MHLKAKFENLSPLYGTSALAPPAGTGLG